MSLLAILDVYLFSDIYYLLISSPTQQVAFWSSWQFPMLYQSFLVCWTVICFFLLLLLLLEKIGQKSYSWDQCQNAYCLFSSRSFMVQGLKISSLNFCSCCWFFECCVRKGSNVPITICWRDSIFPHVCSWPLYHRVIYHMSTGLFLTEHPQLYRL